MELISRAKEHLILYNPFFAYLALQVEFIKDDSVGTSSIDGIEFRYDENWLSEQDHRFVAGLIAHGMGHVLLLHPLRAEGKNIELWNKACDYSVNMLLSKSNIELINDLFDSRFDGMDAEQIYELLKGKQEQEQPNESENGFQMFNDGSNFESEDGSDICKVAMPDMTEQSQSEVESIVSQKIMDAATQAEMCGDGMSEAVKEAVNEVKEPKKDWREILHKFTAEIERNDYDWQRPDLNYLQRDIYIPGLYNEEIGNIIFVRDTSISMNKKILADVQAELKEALSQITKEVTVIDCDTEVRQVKEVQAEDIDALEPLGRGGTKFMPVFDYIENNDLNPKALIYFTDGECWDKLEEPLYPVIWIIYNNPNFVPQFGECIIIND